MTLDTKALRALGSVTIWDPQLRERIKRRGVHDCFDDVDLAFVDALDEIVQLRLALGEALDGWSRWAKVAVIATKTADGLTESMCRIAELRKLVTP